MRVTVPTTTLVPYQFRLTKLVAFGSDVADWLVGLYENVVWDGKID